MILVSMWLPSMAVVAEITSVGEEVVEVLGGQNIHLHDIVRTNCLKPKIPRDTNSYSMALSLWRARCTLDSIRSWPSFLSTGSILSATGSPPSLRKSRQNCLCRERRIHCSPSEWCQARASYPKRKNVYKFKPCDFITRVISHTV